MPSGRDTLESIERSLRQARAETDALDSEFRRAGTELAEIGNAERKVLAELARLHAQGLGAQHGDVDRRLTAVLEARRAEEAALEAEIATAQAALAEAERAAAARRAAVDDAAAAVEEALADVRRRLAGGEYQEQRTEAKRSAAIAVEAESKAAEAELDRIEKGKPYEADPVFRYLWERGYGTSRYRAGPLTRILDRLAARVSGFETLRRNYFGLTEIPVRLKRHAERMRERSAAALERVRALEASAQRTAGVADRREALAAAEALASDAERALAAQRAAVDALQERRAAFAAGEDEHSRECAKLLGDAFRRASLEVLRERAAGTATPEDDRLIGELERLEGERERLKEEAIRYRRLQQERRRRVLELEDVCRRFKDRRYDDGRSSFGDGELISTLLERLLSGSIDVGDVWDSITRERRYRDWDDD